MVIENNPSAKMQVRSRGQLVAPACCVVCGNATCDEGYLDVGAFVDFHGTVYFCMLCIRQGAETCGMFTPEEVGHLQNQIATLLAQKEDLMTELTKANEYINNFDSLLRGAFNPSADSVGVTDVHLPEVTDGPEGGEPAPTEPVTFQKPSGTSGTKLRDITFD